MMREISTFSGSADLERALGLLQTTASASARNVDPMVDLVASAAFLASAHGHAAMLSLADSLGLDPGVVPDPIETAGLFADEMLSARALKLHRGRNVYSACKGRLWDRLWLPFRDSLVIDDATLALTAELVAMRTDAGGADVQHCVTTLEFRLVGLGFAVERIERDGHPPILLARRASSGLAGQLVMYGHYDVATPNRELWRTDPWTLTEVDGRLYGVGVGDNKAALAQRLILLEHIELTPEIIWLIQGEEEVGSPLAHDVVAGLLQDLAPELWLDENGYFDLDGTQRMLARTIADTPNTSAPPDSALWKLIEMMNQESSKFAIASRVECRGLNKSFFAAGCPFNNAIPAGGRYLAIGVNDPTSRIHQPNESVPMWTFPIHARQFRAALRWVGERAAEVTR